jgi:hypothetical protein
VPAAAVPDCPRTSPRPSPGRSNATTSTSSFTSPKPSTARSPTRRSRPCANSCTKPATSRRRAGLAKAVLRDRAVTAWLALARADDLRVITSAATLVEVVHPRINRPALEWTLSRLVIEPVTESVARRAAALLAEASLHGHEYAIDGMLSATALSAPGPTTILTSEPEVLTLLCGAAVTVIKV